MGFSLVNHPFGGSPILGNPHIYINEDVVHETVRLIGPIVVQEELAFVGPASYILSLVHIEP